LVNDAFYPKLMWNGRFSAVYVEPIFALELCTALHDRRQLLVWAKRVVEDRSTMFVYLPTMKHFYDNDPEVEALFAHAR
jgi:hypothetical protein